MVSRRWAARIKVHMSVYYQYRERSYEADSRITWAVQRLIIANVLVFAAQLIADVLPVVGLAYPGMPSAPPGGLFTHLLTFQPGAFLGGQLWKAATYMFVHGGLMHLFLNMLWLFFFGPDVERALGTRPFYTLYGLCGVLSVLANFVPLALGAALPRLFPREEFAVLGASGAVMGVMVAFATVNPHRQFFLFPLPIPINAVALVFLVVVMNLMAALQGGGNTSVTTHFGGMAAGYIYMRLLPVYRRWQRWRQQPRTSRKTLDDIGEAVDNIFRFNDRKR